MNAPLETNESLVALAQSGDAGARERLVLRNWGLVRKEAARFPSLDFDDACQEAALSLLDASRRFNPAKVKRFSTFAVLCIRGDLANLVSLKRVQAGRLCAEVRAAVPEGVDFLALEGVRKRLRRLPARERQAVRLVYGLGRRRAVPMGEAAGIMGLSPKGLQNLARQACDRLRGMFKEEN